MLSLHHDVAIQISDFPPGGSTGDFLNRIIEMEHVIQTGRHGVGEHLKSLIKGEDFSLLFGGFTPFFAVTRTEELGPDH